MRKITFNKRAEAIKKQVNACPEGSTHIWIRSEELGEKECKKCGRAKSYDKITGTDSQ